MPTLTSFYFVCYDVSGGLGGTTTSSSSPSLHSSFTLSTVHPMGIYNQGPWCAIGGIGIDCVDYFARRHVPVVFDVDDDLLCVVNPGSTWNFKDGYSLVD